MHRKSETRLQTHWWYFSSLEVLRLIAAKLCSPVTRRTRHATSRPEFFIIIYNTSSLSEQRTDNQHSLRSEPGFILGLGGKGRRGYERVKRGAVTLTRNVQTVRLTFKSRAAVMCTVFDEGKTEEGCQQSEAMWLDVMCVRRRRHWLTVCELLQLAGCKKNDVVERQTNEIK